MGDAVLGFEILPGLHPVSPGVGHAHGVDLALLFGLRDEVLERHLVVVDLGRGGSAAVVAAGEAHAGHARRTGEHGEELPAGDAALHGGADHGTLVHGFSFLFGMYELSLPPNITFREGQHRERL